MTRGNATTRGPRGRRATGFTLLEAILALIILSAVLMICLQMRSQAITHRTAMLDRLYHDQAVDAIFQKAIHNVLPTDERTVQASVMQWEGDHLGRPYRVEKRLVNVDNPVAAEASQAVAESLRVFQYTIDYREQETSFYWHR